MRRNAFLGLSVLLLFALPQVGVHKSRAAPAFDFVALGDMPYNHGNPSDRRYDRLIAAINDIGPAFTIHVGDIKSGNSPCTDERFAKERDSMNSFEGALVYTPGDNEWTDCYHKKAGNHDPLERLAKLRSMFFATDRSLGQSPIQAPDRPTSMTTRRWSRTRYGNTRA